MNSAIFNPSVLTFRVAKKTKGLRAKPMVNLLVDKTVMSKFLVDTLEAKEPVHADAMFCIGESNDAWQQSAKNLLKKYTVDAIDAEGWLVCNPKAENSVEFAEITDAGLDLDTSFGTAGSGWIVGQWGETINGVQNLQRFKMDDFVVRNREDHSDVWIVARKIFLNTYTELA